MDRREFAIIVAMIVCVVSASWHASGTEINCDEEEPPVGDIELYGVSNVTVRNCRLPDSEVRIEASSDVTVINNSLRHIRIYNSPEKIVIEDNKIIGNSIGDGITVYHSSPMIIGNAINSNRYNGIHLVDGTDGTILIGNDCSNNGNDGILVHPADRIMSVEVVSNVCLNNYYQGITFYKTDDSLLVGNVLMNNSMSGSGEHGLRFNNASNDLIIGGTILNNRVDVNLVHGSENITMIGVEYNTTSFDNAKFGSPNLSFWQMMRSIDYWADGYVADFDLLMVIDLYYE